MTKSRDDGVHSLNQEFRRYEQVNKPQAYYLSEGGGEEQFDCEYQIQICDMDKFFTGGDAGKAAFAAELGEALEGIGFAILTGHGVDPVLYQSAEQKIRDFFETTTAEQRMKYLARRQGSVNQGYFPIRETTIIHPDLVEGWVFCRRAFDLDSNPDYRAADYWPLPDYEKFFRQIVQRHETLILPIMQSLLHYLGCDPHLYDQRLSGTNFGFRLNYYPPLDAAGHTGTGGRMLGHEDVDLFTLLPAPSVQGLQVLNRRNNKWIRLDAPPGSIILNTGDYMQRISNDRLPSTTHRVTRPPAAQINRPRVSFPMAIYLWEEEILEVLPGLGEPHYEPVSAVKFHTRITSKYYGDDYAVG